MKDKIKRLLFARREEIKDKWWDRLFHVFLYLTTAIVLVGSFVFYFQENRGVNFAADNTEKYILSFQLDGELLDDYSGRSGYIADCFLRPDTDKKMITDQGNNNAFPFHTETISVLSVFCGPDDHISIQRSDYWTTFSVNNLIDTLLIRNGYTTQDIDKVRNQRTQGEWLLHFYELGQLDGLKAKIWPTDTLNFLVISSLILAALATALGWFILWESIIYRVILYVVYGRNEHVNKI